MSYTKKQGLFTSIDEVRFALLGEKLILNLFHGKQNLHETVCRDSHLRECYFQLQQNHLMRLAHELNTSPITFSLSMFALLIHRYIPESESVDIIANRHRLTIPVRGCELNTIIMSIKLDENVNESEFISTTSNTDQSSKSIIESPLILTIKIKNNYNTNVMYDFTLTYCNTYMDDTAAHDMCQAYQRLIEHISDIKIPFDLTYHELVSIPLMLSNKSIDGPSVVRPESSINSSVIYTHFEMMTVRCSNQICLQQSESCSLTYGECLSLVDQLSSIFQRQLGVTKGRVLGLWMSSSFEYVIAILAALKVGAIFIPLDAQHPAKRLEFVEKQARVDIILTNSKTSLSTESSPAFLAPRIQMNITDCGILKVDNSYIYPVSSEVKSQIAHNGGYIIFTSGSSGKPKGVLIEESGLFNMALSQIEIFGIKTSDTVAQYASICFDASLSEIFMALLSGACLVIFQSPLQRAGSMLIDLLNSLSVTVITLPPSLLSAIDPKTLPRIRVIISAGEPCPTALAYKWIHQHRQFFNGYGPSEAAVCATQYEFELATIARLPKNETLPIGTPIHNVHIRVVDSQLNDVPAGMPGELLLGGVGVSSNGYIGDVDSKAKKAFVIWNQERWYRTGDMVKTMMADHRMLMYLGRMDSQVKVRGCRIELNEIEKVTLTCFGVTHCIAVLHHCEECVNDNAALALYVDGDATEDSIREKITQKLPSYMLPTYIVIHSSSLLPKTLAGKIDRQLLADDKNIHCQQLTTNSSSSIETQEQLRILWQRVLNGQCNNKAIVKFNHLLTFAQCGGTSQTAAILNALLLKEFSSNVTIHAHMSLEKMATLVLQSKNKPEGISYTTISQDLNCNFNDLIDHYHPRECNGISSILLTGVTGFLGCFLLNELLLTTSMNIVVLVRANSFDDAKNRLHLILCKYDLFNGIVEQIFGNSEQQRVHICLCEDLANENESFFCFDQNNQWNDIDAVLHCAADTNFNKAYEDLRQVNVQLTKYLIQKCSRHGIPLYYISTLSTFCFTQTDNNLPPPLITESDEPKLTSIIGGYSQSKYVADTLVLEALKRGLSGAIFRPGRITGSSLSGIGTKEDMFILMLQGCQQLGAYPQFKFPFDLTPVDRVSKAIVSVITSQQSSRRSSPLIVHLINKQTIPFDEQFKLLKRYGCCTTELEALSFNEWLLRLQQRISVEQQQHLNGYNPLLPLLPFLQSSFWQHVDKWPIFEQTNTTDAVIDMCPKTLFKLYCGVWKRIHLFD